MRFPCGPLSVSVACEIAPVRAKIAEQMRLFDLVWPGGHRPVSIAVAPAASRAPHVRGEYLRCGRMRVDEDGGALVAACPSGLWAEGDADSTAWTIYAPDPTDPWVTLDLEVLLTLLLCEGWRQAGWTPVHGAAVVRGGRCALLCAESGGGKTTLTVAMIRAGWRTLGDDKLLLRLVAGTPEVRGLAQSFNLHPNTRTWFPEVGDLAAVPRYSQWTEKRKVRSADLWPGATTQSAATPTHLAVIQRREEAEGLRAERLEPAETLSALLHQVVVPGGRRAARQILGVVAQTATSLRGLRVRVGENAYAAPSALHPLEEALC